MSDTTTETKSGFARRLSCSRTYVGKLASQGMPLADDGRVPVDRALRWLRDHDKMPAGASAATEQDERWIDKARRYAADDFEAGLIVATMLLQSRWPALATVAAWEAGLSGERARQLFNTVAVAFAEDGQEWLAKSEVQAFRHGEPNVWIGATAEPNWDRLKSGE